MHKHVFQSSHLVSDNFQVWEAISFKPHSIIICSTEKEDSAEVINPVFVPEILNSPL